MIDSPLPARSAPAQVFQLILPELDRQSDEPLFLLVIMCALAPLVSFAGSLIAPEGPTNRGTGG